MFVYQFKTRLEWYCGRMYGDEASILWKIAISGPFVTLYSDMEYVSIGIRQSYLLVYPSFVEHLQTHDENILGKFYPSELRDTHTHVTLPCQGDLVTELRTLLQFIAEHNQPNKKLIHSACIEPCIEAYKQYLHNASCDEHKANAAHLLGAVDICPVEARRPAA